MVSRYPVIILPLVESVVVKMFVLISVIGPRENWNPMRVA